MVINYVAMETSWRSGVESKYPLLFSHITENREAMEKSSKMKKLLGILTNPNQRVSMDILLKCEVALKNMEKVSNSSSVEIPCAA